MMDDKELKRRFSKAKEKKLLWDDHIRECMEYAMPQRETFYHRAEGEKKGQRVYDDTAVIATPIYANRVQQAIIPIGQVWERMVPGALINHEQEINFMGEQMPIEEALGKVVDVAFDYINRSNLASKAHESIMDAAASTGVMTCEYDSTRDELVFDSIPIANVYLEGGPRGRVDGVWRCQKMKVLNIQRHWPLAKIPETLMEKAERDESCEVEIVEGMLYDWKAGDYHLHVAVSENDGFDEIYFENYGPSSPYIVFRSMVAAGETYGRGPLMRVLASIKTLNNMAMNNLKSANLAVSGVWTGRDDGMFNPYTVEISPGVVIPVSSNDNSNPSLRRLDVGGDYQLHEMEMQRRIDYINRALFAQPIGTMDDPTKTATEISMRMQMDLQDSGAEFSRLANELAHAIFERALYLLGDAGIIPKIEVDGEQVQLKHVGPSSQQSEFDEANTLLRVMQATLGSGMPPELVMQDLKVEDMPSFLLEKMGGPVEFKRSAAEKQQMQQQQAAAVQEAGNV